MGSQQTHENNGSRGTWTLKTGLAQMLKGGVIMDVVTPEHAKIAEDAGACAVMALERVPADIRAAGGVARMSDPEIVQRIMDAVTIPVMAKCRIGHFVEAQVLESLGVDYIDESEVLTPADEKYHVYKHDFKVPFVCGARELGEALRRIHEGAAMIRSKGEAGTGNIVEAVRHIRAITESIRALADLDERGLETKAQEYRVPIELVRQVAKDGKLPVVLFCAGGIATPADAALMMQLGAEGNFVGSGIFKSADPARRAKAIGKLASQYGFIEKLRDRTAEGMPVWGTCAGAIFIAKDVPGHPHPLAGLMDMTVERNAFGRQVDSFEADLDVAELGPSPFHAVFIRAPLITHVGRGVDVLATLHDGTVVAARQGRLLATSFHPELTRDERFHRYFLSLGKP